jgi:TldD protein
MLATPLVISKELPNLSYAYTGDRFDQSWAAPLAILLGLGRAAGADFVEFFLERSSYISSQAEEDAITSISPRLSTGAGVRVIRGKADGYVSTNDLSFNGLRRALEKALGITGLQLPGPTAFIPEINLEWLRDYGSQRGKDNWLKQCKCCWPPTPPWAKLRPTPSPARPCIFAIGRKSWWLAVTAPLRGMCA